MDEILKHYWTLYGLLLIPSSTILEFDFNFTPRPDAASVVHVVAIQIPPCEHAPLVRIATRMHVVSEKNHQTKKWKDNRAASFTALTPTI